MSANEYIQDALTSHQIYTQRYSAGEAKKVEKQLDKMFSQITDRLGDSNTPFTQERLVSLRRDIYSMIDELALGVEINNSAVEFAKYETEYITDLLDKATVASASITSIAPEYVAAMTTSTPLVLTSTSGKVTTATITQLVDKFDMKVRSQVLNVLNNGALEGLPVNTIARQIKAKTSKRTLNQSKALTRTVLNHIGSQARQSVYNENRDIIEKERYVATLDSRTTFICASNDGRLFPVGSGPVPALHWNCRSIRSPVVSSKFGLDGLVGTRGFVAGPGDRGTVSAKTTFSGWLKDQPKEFQDEYLGEYRAKLFRSGGYTIDKFLDNGKVISIERLKELDAQTKINLIK